MSITQYSDEIPGEEGNYFWPVSFEKTTPGGFVGILQTKGVRGNAEKVLLSRRQVKALIKFIGARRSRSKTSRSTAERRKAGDVKRKA